MIKFSSEQLLVLRSALASPLPPPAPPPGMGRPPPPTTAPPPPARAQPALAAMPAPPPHQCAATSLPLAPLGAAYLCVAGAVALASIAAPGSAADGAILASPLLALALGAHALALLQSSPCASLLALCCALSTPALLRLAPPPRWGPWLCCAAISVFFVASAPRGLLRVFSAAGLVAVAAASAGALLSEAHMRAAWGAALVALSIQSAISTGRLRGQRLRLSVTESNGA
jgi:hypothetical protein